MNRGKFMPVKNHRKTQCLLLLKRMAKAVFSHL